MLKARRQSAKSCAKKTFITKDATSFVSCAQSMRGVSVEEVTDEEMTRHKDLSLANIFEEAASIAGF